MSQDNVTGKQPLIRYVNRQQMSWRAVDVEKLIGEDHPARAIWTLVGRLDLSSFYRVIESSAEEGGRPAFDPQARVMKQSDGGLALSYNAQISADAAHGLIVGAAVTQEANDSAQLLAAVDRMEERLKKKPQQMVADGGYTTRDNIEKMAGRGIDFLGSMEKTTSGATAPQRLPPSAFVYQSERNLYLCPEGKWLRSQGRHNNKRKRGMVAYRYEGRFSDCQPCVRKPECCPENQSQGRGLLRWEESATVAAFRGKMGSVEARAHSRRRGPVVEFCHAWIKTKLGLRQFHVRGLEKVGTELLWACLTYNLQQWIRLSKPDTAAAG
jgi:hypothetical protein